MELLYRNLTEKIIGALFEVHKDIGPGLTEVIYKRALLHELGLRGLKAEAEKEISVFYKCKSVGKYRVDILVDEKVILELKVTSMLEPIHEAQLISYLKSTNYKVGLLVNFGKKKLEFKRFICEESKYDKK